MKRHLLFVLLSLPMLPACDSVDAESRGEPLLSLRGKTLAAPSAAAPKDDLKVVLAWRRFATDPVWFGTEEFAIAGSFPAAFDLDVYNAPPEAALNHFEEGDPGVAIGIIFGVPTVGVFGEDPVKGVVEEHVLAYAAADIAGDTPLGAFVGGPMTAGFHLLQVTPATAEDFAQREACFKQEDTGGCGRLTPVPFDTSLNLVLNDFAALKAPGFEG